MKIIVIVLVKVDFDHQSSHLGTIMMIISLRLGTIRILFIDEPSTLQPFDISNHRGGTINWIYCCSLNII